MCENLHYESVYFKELHNKQEYYWPTIYRAGAAVVSTITGRIPQLKDFGGFKGRQKMSRCQVVAFAISANFGFNLSVNIYARQNPYKNCKFLVGF